MRRLVLGLGNPILGDDGVGWCVAERVARELGPASPVAEVDCAAAGGLGLMERLVGYDDVVLVDALHTGGVPPGTVRRVSLDALPDPTAGHSASPHDASLATALALGRALRVPLPACVTVVAIETGPAFEFDDTLSPAVAAAVPAAVATVLAALTAGATGKEYAHGIP